MRWWSCLRTRYAASPRLPALPILPGWLDRQRLTGFCAAFEIVLRGAGSHVLWFHDGGVTVDPPRAPRIDVHTSPPTRRHCCSCSTGENLYGRPSQPAACSPWGRRPWLAPTLTSRFLKL